MLRLSLILLYRLNTKADAYVFPSFLFVNQIRIFYVSEILDTNFI
jgi:hypothetical protein